MYNDKPRQKHLSSRIEVSPKLMEELELFKKNTKAKSVREVVEKLLTERLLQLTEKRCPWCDTFVKRQYMRQMGTTLYCSDCYDDLTKDD